MSDKTFDSFSFETLPTRPLNVIVKMLTYSKRFAEEKTEIIESLHQYYIKTEHLEQHHHPQEELAW